MRPLSSQPKLSSLTIGSFLRRAPRGVLPTPQKGGPTPVTTVVPGRPHLAHCTAPRHARRPGCTGPSNAGFPVRPLNRPNFHHHAPATHDLSLPPLPGPPSPASPPTPFLRSHVFVLSWLPTRNATHSRRGQGTTVPETSETVPSNLPALPLQSTDNVDGDAPLLNELGLPVAAGAQPSPNGLL